MGHVLEYIAFVHALAHAHTTNSSLGFPVGQALGLAYPATPSSSSSSSSSADRSVARDPPEYFYKLVLGYWWSTQSTPSSKDQEAHPLQIREERTRNKEKQRESATKSVKR